jgi:hypothetical protein
MQSEKTASSVADANVKRMAGQRMSPFAAVAGFTSPNPADDPPTFSQANPVVTGVVAGTAILAGDVVTCKMIDALGQVHTSTQGAINVATGAWSCSFVNDVPPLTGDPMGVFNLSILTAYAIRGANRLAPPLTIHVNVVQ